MVRGIYIYIYNVVAQLSQRWYSMLSRDLSITDISSLTLDSSIFLCKAALVCRPLQNSHLKFIGPSATPMSGLCDLRNEEGLDIEGMFERV